MCGEKQAYRERGPKTPDELLEEKIALERKKKRTYNDVLEEVVR